MSKKYFTPKRVILKIMKNFISSFGTGQAAVTLFTATDPVTLVRIVGSNMITGVSVAGTGGMLIVLVREGFAPLTMNITSGNAIYERPNDVLWGSLYRNPAADANMHIFQEIDVKGMRKLKRGDRIDILNLGSAGNVINSIGSLTLFFKET